MGVVQYLKMAAGRPQIDQLLEWLDSLVEWEKFALFLPSISHSVVDTICLDKPDTGRRKMALYSKWLDKYPSASWDDVITALEKADERMLAEQIRRKLKSIGITTIGPISLDGVRDEDVDVERIRETIIEVLENKFALIKKATQHCLRTVADEMFSQGFISDDVRDEHDYGKMVCEYKSMLYFAFSLSVLKDKCSKFLECLAKPSGPAKASAQALATDWNKIIYERFNFKMSFSI